MICAYSLHHRLIVKDKQINVIMYDEQEVNMLHQNFLWPKLSVIILGICSAILGNFCNVHVSL